MFRKLLVSLLFASALCIRSLSKANVSLHALPRAKCALICHLPPPYHKWDDFLEDRCDPATSLFIDVDKGPLKQLERAHLSVVDLFKVAYFLKLDYGDKYQLLVADLYVAQGVLFGHVVDMEETETQNKIVMEKWTGDIGDKESCIAYMVLDRIGMFYKTYNLHYLDMYGSRRSKCFANKDKPVIACSTCLVEHAKIELEEALPRNDVSGGRDALVAKLTAVLPPASETCSTPEECLESRFVNSNTWDPPENLAHLYDRVIFVGCDQFAFAGRAVQSALKLVASGGEIIVYGYTLEELEQQFAIMPFAKVPGSWQRSSHDNITVLSAPSKSASEAESSDQGGHV